MSLLITGLVLGAVGCIAVGFAIGRWP